MSVKNAVLFLGVVFLAIGILGFFNNPLFGLFEVDTLLNVIHLATGVVAVAMAVSSEDGAREFSKIFGVIYAILGVVGLLYPADTLFGLMTDTMSDSLLHVVFGAVFLGLGYASQTRANPTSLHASR